VDTIFEIGGQDAKYTYITNGVPSDYAMNEACSAGTGSFLEEAAKETLGIETEDIADIALRGSDPPNFNDQCAAFISSDIKNAFHEGITGDDIVAGLVYSICMNYANRVKGNRPVGRRVFMQGGVCYNRAVPLAMAVLTGKSIIVPPEPGLIGAFGVALEIKRRLSLNLMAERSFSLRHLQDRTIEYGPTFICNGGKEKCDRKCEIARIRIEGKTHPFGGACNRWYNLRSGAKVDAGFFNLVDHHERMVFPAPGPEDRKASPTIGINKSFLVNTYFPLYRSFFSRIGFEVILPDKINQEGIDRKSSPFCYPAEIAHGYFSDLLQKNPDYLFLPQFKGDRVENGPERGVTCPLSQGEPFYLASTFKDHETFMDLKGKGKILEPIIDFSGGFDKAKKEFVRMSSRLGVSKKRARLAYEDAVREQENLFQEMKRKGSDTLKALENNPGEFGVVIIGRPYNALVSEAHMGIPNKFASRGIRVIPYNFLDLAKESIKRHMYWSAGQHILRGARFIKKHPQLFGCYITNFSCGPDSFLVGYFRDIMGEKPSLTLELDSHVADAGLETRIEAFLDIVMRYREIEKEKKTTGNLRTFVPASVKIKGTKQVFIDSVGGEHSIFDPRVHLIFPSMGRFISEVAAAVYRGAGIRSSALPPSNEAVLKIGRGNTSCKECLPLLLTTGSLLKYIDEREKKDELLIYFMPTASGPCRYGQYSVFLNDLIARLRLKDVTLYSLSAENSYADLGGQNITARLWAGAVVADIFEEIHSLVLTNAVDRKSALKIFERAWERVITCLEKPSNFKKMTEDFTSAAEILKGIEAKRTAEETPVVLLTGEIYVRHDDISRQFLTEELAQEGFAVKVSTLAEWVYYTGWCVKKRLSTGYYSRKDRAILFLRTLYMKRYEKRIREIFSKTGLCLNKLEDVEHIINHTRHLISPQLVGEAILTTGAAINEVLDHYCGAIAIGPFGCMPNRLSEAILTGEMNMKGKMGTGRQNHTIRYLSERIDDLPFLAIESDGNRFPQIITAKLEAFLLQAERVHKEMSKAKRLHI
jgi:predicted nucleotide-binding protein (sugar kinase/HSP70/actin superfamily)